MLAVSILLFPHLEIRNTRRFPKKPNEKCTLENIERDFESNFFLKIADRLL